MPNHDIGLVIGVFLFSYYIISITYVAYAEDIPVATWPALLFTVGVALTVLIYGIQSIFLLISMMFGVLP
jgi:hypothetical protein